MDKDRLLDCVGSTEPSTFSEFLRALEDDCPEKGDKPAWAKLFSLIEECERDGLLVVERVKGKVDSLQLTPEGADAVRDRLDAKRGLFGGTR